MALPAYLGSLVTLLVVLAVAAACAPAPATAPARPPSAAEAASAPPTAAPVAAAPTNRPRADDAPLSPPVDVKLGVFGTLGDAGFYVAEERGYFLQEGLNVEEIPSESAPRIIPFLASGQVDVAGLSQTPGLFNAVGRGIGIKVVADKGRVLPGHAYAALVLRKDLVENGAVRGYGDLRGLRLATPGRGTAMWTELWRALDAGGLSFADVQEETLSQPDMMQALANGALDGAMLLEPFLTAAANNGTGVAWRSIDEFAPNAMNGLVAYAPSFIQNQPEAAKRFMVAYLRGLRDYIDAFDHGIGKDEMVDLLIKHTPVKNRALYATMQPVGFDPNGLINVDYLRVEQDIYAREGLLTDPADVSALVDLQYVEYATARLGRR
jgi:NitT/TauT family transport system substrate-binding protein